MDLILAATGMVVASPLLLLMYGWVRLLEVLYGNGPSANWRYAPHLVTQDR
jgi:hypothetical protein